MRRLVAAPLACCLLVAIVACARLPGPAATATLRPTATSSPTAAPTATVAAFPSATPQIYCEGVAPSLLIIGERGRVTRTDDGRWLNLRSGPGTDNEVIAQLAPLESFLVLDGVECNGPYAWYQVNYRGQVGWIAEGYDGQYYAEPWLTG